MTTRSDFERTGVSDTGWPTGNPPAGCYRVIGMLPDHRRTIREHGMTVHQHRITVRDSNGGQHTLIVRRPANQPPPRVGQDLAGRVTSGAFPELQENSSNPPKKEDQQVPLPQQKTSREGRDPRDARVLLSSPPKIGKTTLLSQWAPDTTLILDTHKGTALLDGEHYVQPIDTFNTFEKTVDELAGGGHQFRTIGVDLIEDIYRFAQRQAAQSHGKIAAASVEFGKGTGEADELFKRAIDKLLATSYGIWFVTHVDIVQDGKDTLRVPRLDKRIKSYIEGVADFNLIGENAGQQGRILHTAPSAQFQAGSRTPLPVRMPLDARALYVEIARGFAKPKPAEKKAEPEPVAA